MPQKKKPKPAAPLPTKASFFQAKREYCEAVTVKAEPVASVAQRQRLLYDKETGLPFAEVIDNAAVCLHTGQELFRFKDREQRMDEPLFASRFDFTPPGGKKHPNERSVDVRAMVDARILSDEDVRTQRAFSDEELSEMTRKLGEYQAEREAMCVFRME